MDGKKGFFILVFGGTSGIGFCVAEAALEQGASVFISGSNPNKLTSALTSLIEAYPTAGNRPNVVLLSRNVAGVGYTVAPVLF
jgi:NAD(P)-dependent dehydrogenase (short-subunit alcohol dehydrogenase family)